MINRKWAEIKIDYDTLPIYFVIPSTTHSFLWYDAKHVMHNPTLHLQHSVRTCDVQYSPMRLRRPFEDCTKWPVLSYLISIIVDQHLNWKEHISIVSHKISKSCGIISSIRNTLDIKSKKMIYYSLIHPYLTYCINVWSSTYRTNLKIICTAQKRSVRTLFATAQQPHSRDIFINLKILPLDKLINQQDGILAYKVTNGTFLLNDFLNHEEVRHQI